MVSPLIIVLQISYWISPSFSITGKAFIVTWTHFYAHPTKFEDDFTLMTWSVGHDSAFRTVDQSLSERMAYTSDALRPYFQGGQETSI